MRAAKRGAALMVVPSSGTKAVPTCPSTPSQFHLFAFAGGVHENDRLTVKLLWPEARITIGASSVVESRSSARATIATCGTRSKLIFDVLPAELKRTEVLTSVDVAAFQVPSPTSQCVRSAFSARYR